MEKKLLYKIQITGDVQGVGFRWCAANEARSRGINGFVRNETDGSVYIEAEGYRDQLNYFVSWCESGPGDVAEVKTESFPAVNYSDFRIVH